MNQHDFVNMIRVAVEEAASKGVIDALRFPPGRRPDPQLLNLSNWFNGLSEEERSYLFKVVQMTAQQTVYNLLLLLDGLLAIESGPDKGRIELTYNRGAARVILNDSDKLLSDLFKSAT